MSRTRPVPRCEHHCACGAVHICGDFDRCIVPQSNNPYVCPACELDALDDYLNRLQPATEEPAHADHRQR